MNLWNVKDLPLPPVNTYRVRNKNIDLKNLYSTCESIKLFFEKNEYMKAEYLVLSRIIYRMKQKFRSAKDFKALEKVHKALENYFSIPISKYASIFMDLIPLRYKNETYLPTKNLLDYMLVRFQGLVKLLDRIVETSKIAGFLLDARIKVGHFWKVAFISFSLISRVYILAKYNAKCICEFYKELLPFSSQLQNTKNDWLPKDYIFPKDLRVWMNVDWLDIDDEIKIIETPTEIPDILQLFDLIDDDDDVEFCDEYVMVDDETDVEIIDSSYDVSETTSHFFDTDEDLGQVIINENTTLKPDKSYCSNKATKNSKSYSEVINIEDDVDMAKETFIATDEIANVTKNKQQNLDKNNQKTVIEAPKKSKSYDTDEYVKVIDLKGDTNHTGNESIEIIENTMKTNGKHQNIAKYIETITDSSGDDTDEDLEVIDDVKENGTIIEITVGTKENKSVVKKVHKMGKYMETPMDLRYANSNEASDEVEEISNGHIEITDSMKKHKIPMKKSQNLNKHTKTIRNLRDYDSDEDSGMTDDGMKDTSNGHSLVITVGMRKNKPLIKKIKNMEKHRETRQKLRNFDTNDVIDDLKELSNGHIIEITDSVKKCKSPTKKSQIIDNHKKTRKNLRGYDTDEDSDDEVKENTAFNFICGNGHIKNETPIKQRQNMDKHRKSRNNSRGNNTDGDSEVKEICNQNSTKKNKYITKKSQKKDKHIGTRKNFIMKVTDSTKKNRNNTMTKKGQNMGKHMGTTKHLSGYDADEHSQMIVKKTHNGSIQKKMKNLQKKMKNLNKKNQKINKFNETTYNLNDFQTNAPFDCADKKNKNAKKYQNSKDHLRNLGDYAANEDIGMININRNIREKKKKKREVSKFGKNKYDCLEKPRLNLKQNNKKNMRSPAKLKKTKQKHKNNKRRSTEMIIGVENKGNKRKFDDSTSENTCNKKIKLESSMQHRDMKTGIQLQDSNSMITKKMIKTEKMLDRSPSSKKTSSKTSETSQQRPESLSHLKKIHVHPETDSPRQKMHPQKLMNKRYKAKKSLVSLKTKINKRRKNHTKNFRRKENKR